MRLVLPEVLSDSLISAVLEMLRKAPPGHGWQDGTATSGSQSIKVKHNAQMPEDGEVTRRARELILGQLAKHPLFMMAALPRAIYPPNFNRYCEPGDHFGEHIDNALRKAPGSAGFLRTDLSCTLFLSEPDTYEGGELILNDASRHKLAAGDAFLYPANTIHRVTPVTRGERIACFFWVESLIRSHDEREVLYNMDLSIMRLRQQYGETQETVGLTGCYHNLLRLWANP